jgi:CHAT domain-containing protein
MKTVLFYAIFLLFFCVKTFAQPTEMNPSDSTVAYSLGTKAVLAGEFAKALLLFQKAATIYQKRGSTKGEIQALVEAAVVVYKQRQVVKAITLLEQQVARISPEMNMLKIEMYAAHKLAVMYNQQGDIKRAAQIVQNAYKQMTRLGPTEVAHYTGAFKNIEGLIAEKQNNIPLALKYYNESIAMQQKSKNTMILLHISFAYNNMGGLYEKREEWQNAQLYYEKAYNNAMKYDSKSSVCAMSLYNMAYPMEEQGKYQDALAAYQKVLLLYNAQKKANDELQNKDEADVYTAMSGCYVQLHNMEQARIYAARSLAISQRLAIAESRETDFANIIATNQVLAKVEMHQNQPKNALNYLVLAEKAAQAAGDDYFLSGVLRLKAEIYSENIALGDAEPVFAHAMAIAKKLDMPVKMALLQSDLACFRYKQGRKDYADLLLTAKPVFTKYQIITRLAVISALEYALLSASERTKHEQLRLSALQNCLLPNTFIKKITDPIAPSSVVQAEPYLEVLEILTAASSGDEKLYFQEKAMQYLLFLRKGIQSEVSKLNISLLMRKYVDAALREASLKNDAATAFRFIEYTKSLSVLEAQQRNKSRQCANLPKAILAQEKQLQAQLFVLEKQLNNDEITEVNTINNKAIYTKITQINNEFEAFERNNLQKDTKTEMDLSRILYDLQIALPPTAAFLDYYWSTDALYLVVVENKKINFFSVAIDKNRLTNTIAAFLLAIKNKNIAAFSSSNESLANALFHFQNTHIEKLLITKKHWIIAPDDALFQVPFDILQNSNPTNNNNFLNFPYLIRQHSLVYQYSAALYLQSKMQEYSVFKRGLLAVAPFTMRNELPIAEMRNGLSGAKLAALPYSKKEVDALEREMKANVFVGNKATKSDFLANAPNYGVLHLATHTVYDSTDKEYNLVFFDENKKSYTFLKNHEIAYSSLAAELVALSACNTANGTIETGEGAASLARAFAYTGTPNVLTTLWEVPDQANAVILQAFYANIKKGMPKDEALQQAKLHYLSIANPENADPQAWAGTQIIGNDSPVVCLSAAWWQSCWAVAAFLGLLVSAGLFIKRKVFRPKIR